MEGDSQQKARGKARDLREIHASVPLPTPEKGTEPFQGQSSSLLKAESRARELRECIQGTLRLTKCSEGHVLLKLEVSWRAGRNSSQVPQAFTDCKADFFSRLETTGEKESNTSEAREPLPTGLHWPF